MQIKSKIVTLATIMALTGSNLALAQNTAPRHPIMGAGYPMVMQAGEYSIENYDRAMLQSKYLDVFKANQQADRDLVLQTIMELETTLRLFLGDVINGPTGIQTLRDNSYTTETSNGVPMSQFFGLNRKLQQSITEINAKLKGLEELPKSLKSVKTSDTNGEDITSTLNVGFKDLADYYRDQIGNIIRDVQKIQFKVDLGTEFGIGFYTLKDSDEIIQKVRISRADLEKLRKQSKKLEHMAMRTAKKATKGAYSAIFVKKIRSYMETFGTSQRYRPQNNQDGLNMATQELEEAFWTRSYLRAVYGFSLGGFGVNWEKKWLNFDDFNSTELDFTGAISQADELNAMYDKIINALATMEKKSGKEIEGELNIMAKVTSTITYLAGKSQSAVSNVVILKLLAADLKEEMLLARAGGRRAVFELYQTRYKSTEEDTEFYNDLKDRYTDIAFDEESDDPFADVTVLDNNSIRGVFRDVTTELDGVQDMLDKASDLRSQYQAFRKGSKKGKNSRKASSML